jgi:hypothetical protein
MKTLNLALLGVAFAGALLLSQPVAACEPHSGPIKITIKLDPQSGAPISVSPDPARVCAGDEVRWLIPGAPGKDFELVFPDGAPFEWQENHGANWIGIVKSEATGDHKYDVVIEGTPPLDPVIIVEP